MPVYKYICEECGGITKISRRMTEKKTPDVAFLSYAEYFPRWECR